MPYEQFTTNQRIVGVYSWCILTIVEAVYHNHFGSHFQADVVVNL